METPKFRPKVRAAMACRIVNLDRVKFNDAVSSGTYPCAPSTRSGAARIFEVEELLPLFFFARLTEFGIPAARAGQIACEVGLQARLDSSVAADRIILLRSSTREIVIPSVTTYLPSVGKEPSVYDPMHETPNEKHPNGWHYPGLGKVIFAVEFYISHVRAMIEEQLAYETSILGEEDDKLL